MNYKIQKEILQECINTIESMENQEKLIKDVQSFIEDKKAGKEIPRDLSDLEKMLNSAKDTMHELTMVYKNWINHISHG